MIETLEQLRELYGSASGRAKAFMRSKLWSELAKIDRESFPTMGKILNNHLGDVSMPESRQAMLARYKDQM
jgi:uncharacterized protein